MNDVLRIALDETGTVHRPGDAVSGRIEWAFDRPADALELRLFWYTEGRGDRDAGVARSLRIETPGPTGSQRFELDLPSGPYSFSGRLVSLIWALELVASPGDRTERQEIVVSPLDGEIVLDRAGAP